MKLNGNAVKPGNVIEHNGRLWTAVKVAHVKLYMGDFYSGPQATIMLYNIAGFHSISV